MKASNVDLLALNASPIMIIAELGRANDGNSAPAHPFIDLIVRQGLTGSLDIGGLVRPCCDGVDSVPDERFERCRSVLLRLRYPRP